MLYLRSIQVVAVGVLLVSVLALQATAQEREAEGRLGEIEKEIDSDTAKSEALAAAESDLRKTLRHVRGELRLTARRLREQELLLTKSEQELVSLSAKRGALQTALGERRAQLGGTLAALQRLALRPPPMLLLAPGDPNDLVRSGLLLRTAVPRIQERARGLENELIALAEVERQIKAEQARVAAANDALTKENDQLNELSQQKADLLNQTEEDRAAAIARIERLTREAGDLQELLALLEEERQARIARAKREAEERARRELAERELFEKERLARLEEERLRLAQPLAKPVLEGEQIARLPVTREPRARPEDVVPGLAPISSARGSLTPPAFGEVVQRFGEETEFGGTSRGITYRTRPSSAVLAPWDGQVVFSGPFRTFGQILIIEHGEGYHSLLAGIARIDVDVGQWVLAGEPVGTTSGGTASSDEQARLYVELRRKGEPINPLPWLATVNPRVQG